MNYRGSEYKSVEWIINNTKECPKCKVLIEKASICNQIICMSWCQHEFCWLCLRPWIQHNFRTGGYYKCTYYEKHLILLNNQTDSYVFSEYSIEAYKKYSIYNSFLEQLMTSDMQVFEELMSRLICNEGFNICELNFVPITARVLARGYRMLKWVIIYLLYLPPGNESELIFVLQEKYEMILPNIAAKIKELCSYEFIDINDFVATKNIILSNVAAVDKNITRILDDLRTGLIESSLINTRYE